MSNGLCEFVFEQDGDGFVATCANCGRVVRVKSRRVYASCRAVDGGPTPKELAQMVADGVDPDGWKPAQIGDLVERGLKAVGITEDRVKRWTGAKDCGCSRRRSALNAHGERLQRRVREAAKAARDMYLGR